MKQSVLAWDMRKAFTLLEVMVAVLIISIVIMALLQMRGHSAHIFSSLIQKLEINQYLSFLVSNDDYGFEQDTMTADRLVKDFDIDSDLRQNLKKVKVDLIYQELDSIDLDEQDDENLSSGMVFEIGKTILKTDKASVSLPRIRLQ
jgi:prepilin-type N-terminal cleavage/methylation domain-containing protein